MSINSWIASFTVYFGSKPVFNNFEESSLWILIIIIGETLIFAPVFSDTNLAISNMDVFSKPAL